MRLPHQSRINQQKPPRRQRQNHNHLPIATHLQSPLIWLAFHIATVVLARTASTVVAWCTTLIARLAYTRRAPRLSNTARANGCRYRTCNLAIWSFSQFPKASSLTWVSTQVTTVSSTRRQAAKRSRTQHSKTLIGEEG